MPDVYQVQDDGTSPKEALPVVVTKTVEAQEHYSLNDLASEIASIDSQINNLAARKTELEMKKAAIQKELDKLPPR
jgi:hypothetical protein